MFEDLHRELKPLEQGLQLSVPIQLDDDRYFERLCPSAECGALFKMQFDDWRDKVPNEIAYCAFCRHTAKPADFNTSEQQGYLKQVALAEITRRFQRGLTRSVEEFNRQQPAGGFITMHTEARLSPVPIAVPPSAAEAMILRVTCEECRCRFAAIGAAYFCPACGENSAAHTFDQSLTIARNAVAQTPVVAAALPDRDSAAQISQALTENALGNLVTAFQRFAEAQYPQLSNAKPKIRRNAFQNLDEGSRLWVDAGGTAYSMILTSHELAGLRRLFQQRHLLAHREGMVDQEYIDRSGDTTYSVGQRIVVRPRAILRLADLLQRLVAGLRADLP